jgi:hypothetical protein
MQNCCLSGFKNLDHKTKQTSFVHSIFGGYLHSSVKCTVLVKPNPNPNPSVATALVSQTVVARFREAVLHSQHAVGIDEVAMVEAQHTCIPTACLVSIC